MSAVQRLMIEHIGLARVFWSPGRFITGDCHTLAMALHESSGRGGSLQACLYGEGSYSHMVFIDANQRSWDVNGEGAQQRWKDRMTCAIRWVSVPCAEPDYKDTKRWLRAHNGRLNTPLQRQLLKVFAAHAAGAVCGLTR